MENSFPRPALLLAWACLFFFLSFISADAEKCPRNFNISSESIKMAHCKHIGEMGATLSWTYNAQQASIVMAFKAKPTSKHGWVAWGINPSSSGMVGTQALLAFRQPNGTMFTGTYSGVSKAGTSPAAEFIPRTDSSQGLEFQSQSSEYRHGSITVYATVLLPSNKTTVNQVWQVGSAGQGGMDAFAITNLQSFGSIDLVKGKIPNTNTTTPSPASAPAHSPSSFSSPSESPSLSPPPPPSSSPTPSPAGDTLHSPSPSPSTPNPPSSSPSPTALSPSSSPSPLPSAGTNNANAHPAISTISFSVISLLTAFACAIFSTM